MIRRAFYSTTSILAQYARAQKYVPARFNLKAIKNTKSRPATQSVKVPSTKLIQEKLKQSTLESLGLRDDVVKSLQNMDIKKPSAIQMLATPEIAAGKHVLLAAETGSGKTLAYMAPIVSRLRMEEDQLGYKRLPRRPRALVLVPSRELVQQVTAVGKSLSHLAKFRIEGITDKKPHCKGDLEGLIDIVVGVPSKIAHFKESQMLHFSNLRYLVVDEADTMLDKDFGEQVREFIDILMRREHGSAPLQVILCSATIPKSLNDYADGQFANRMVKVVSPKLHCTQPGLQQRFIRLKGQGDNKQHALVDLLKEIPPSDGKNKTIIFCNTLGSARSLHVWLSAAPEAVEALGGSSKLGALHSRIPKEERWTVIEDFKEGRLSTLICTDIASRGLDTTFVNHVILYDFPYSAIDYLHRVGRTARAGSRGVSTSFVSRKDATLANQIEGAVRRKEAVS